MHCHAHSEAGVAWLARRIQLSSKPSLKVCKHPAYSDSPNIRPQQKVATYVQAGEPAAKFSFVIGRLWVA